MFSMCLTPAIHATSTKKCDTVYKRHKKRTFLVEPDSNSLVDIVQHRDGYSEQHLREIRTEKRHRAALDTDVDPALQFQDAPQRGKHATQTNANHRHTDQVTEQVALPRRIVRLITTGHRTPDNTTLLQ